MSEEKKCINNEELPEGVTELSMEDLEQVTGGAKAPFYPGVILATTKADITAELAAKK